MFHYHAGGERVPVHVRCQTYLVHEGDTLDQLRDPSRSHLADFDLLEAYSLPVGVQSEDGSWYAEIEARWTLELRLATQHMGESVDMAAVPVPEARLGEVLKGLSKSPIEYLQENKELRQDG